MDEGEFHSNHLIIQVIAALQMAPKASIYSTDGEKLTTAVRNLAITTPELRSIADINGFLGNLTLSLQDYIKKASKPVDIRKKTVQ
jgi:hypothetical protein